MSTKSTNPKWWQLYLTLPVLLALFAIDGRLKISARGHQAMQIAIVLVVYGLIHMWLKANRSALWRMDQQQLNRTLTIIRIPPAEPPDSGTVRRSILELSDSEIQGLLNDTMDMSYIDAESSSMDELRKN